MNNLEKFAVAWVLAVTAGPVWAYSPYYPRPIHAPAAAWGPAHYTYPYPVAMPYPPAAYPRAGLIQRSPPTPAGTAPALAWPSVARTPQPAPAAPAEAQEGLPASPPADKNKQAAAAPETGDTKARFLERLRPLIEQENARLLAERRALAAIIGRLDRGLGLIDAEHAQLKSLAATYRVESNPAQDPAARRELLDKVDTLPVSLALAQAANESAWGRSRFAREGNNLFGIWTYDESQGIVPRKRAAGKKHLVRKFDSEADSVRHYMLTLNSHPAYAELRRIRAELRDKGQPLDGERLADGLARYSAKGEEYVRLIQGMIRRLDLAAYDDKGRSQA